MEELKRILIDLKEYLQDSNNITREESQLFHLLLKSIRSEIESGLFAHLVESNVELSELTATLESKIETYKTELEQTKEQSDANIVGFTSKKAAALEKLIAMLENIKKGLDTKEPDKGIYSAFDSMSTQELVDRCSPTLALGYLDFQEYFGQPLVVDHKSNFKGYTLDYDTIVQITDLMMKKDIHDELIEYYQAVKDCDKTRDRVSEIESIIDRYKLLAEHKDELVDLFKKKRQLGVLMDALRSQDGTVSIIYNHVADLERELASIDTPLQRIFHKVKIEKLKHQLEELKNRLASSREVKHETEEIIRNVKGEIEVKSHTLTETPALNGIVYSDSVARRYSPYPNVNHTEESVYDIESEIDSPGHIEERLERCNAQLDEANQTLAPQEKRRQELYDGLSSEAREYADRDIYSTRRTIAILERERRYNVNPAISMFILRAMVESKKISWKDLSDVMSLITKSDTKELEEQYERLLQRIVSNNTTKAEEYIDAYEERYSPKM